MNRIVQIVRAKSDDWEGLYVNDKLVLEQSAISLDDVSPYLIKGCRYEELSCSVDDVRRMEGFPPTLQELFLEIEGPPHED